MQVFLRVYRIEGLNQYLFYIYIYKQTKSILTIYENTCTTVLYGKNLTIKIVEFHILRTFF